MLRTNAEESLRSGAASAADLSRERGATPGATPAPEDTRDMVLEPATATACNGAALGTILPTVNLGYPSSSYAGANMSATVAASNCPCKGFRWIQVAQIIPPVTVGANSNIVGQSNLKRPWVDGALGSGLPYYEALGVIATAKINDTPALSRIPISTGTPSISFLFDTACMCLRSGKKDQFIGLFSWGFYFGSVPMYDVLLGPTLHSAPTAFWKDGVATDFPAYPYVV